VLGAATVAKHPAQRATAALCIRHLHVLCITQPFGGRQGPGPALLPAPAISLFARAQAAPGAVAGKLLSDRRRRRAPRLAAPPPFYFGPRRHLRAISAAAAAAAGTSGPWVAAPPAPAAALWPALAWHAPPPLPAAPAFVPAAPTAAAAAARSSPAAAARGHARGNGRHVTIRLPDASPRVAAASPRTAAGAAGWLDDLSSSDLDDDSEGEGGVRGGAAATFADLSASIADMQQRVWLTAASLGRPPPRR